ncbi:cell division protein ZapE [Brevundimonas subvibrioides]|uniref:AFG1-family ATPase n=1 Tax=Brevundimonas subvibrioides (strain ATCC 15264 / DSM 4735 / LMG 14903 / NBRC 16000 / CB 81) TaxID=633149 RepID=D9QKD3_BRESC|nr:cell division protein ZapE [Brevundimonas subvibrioides]ADK99758.1 AFG1-family ATPase [Brevundimonas subvibrioides ATCC 15264]
MPSRIARAYENRLKQGLLTRDPAQKTAVAALSRLEIDLGKRKLFGGTPEVRGVYLWGPPGRGKSILMDLFFVCAPEPRKTRAHFHAFMARVHDLIRQWREGDRKARQGVFGTHKGDDPIGPVAALIASEARLLCFDELQVTDIADAMILGRLFDALFEKKVVVCITSNRAPDQLYKDGINRPLFTPFIDRIVDRCEVVALSGARDWRLDRLKASGVWHDAGDRAGFEQLWDDLRGGMPECPAHLEVLGRDVRVDRTAGGLARATFDQLCDTPLGPQDYLAVARRFHTVFIEDIPVLTPDRRQAARRFVTLIDALYEARTRIVVLAAGAPQTLYPAGDGAFEFERTVSRLNEMSSASWLETAADRSDPG